MTKNEIADVIDAMRSTARPRYVEPAQRASEQLRAEQAIITAEAKRIASELEVIETKLAAIVTNAAEEKASKKK